jgi:hypothetical protein
MYRLKTHLYSAAIFFFPSAALTQTKVLRIIDPPAAETAAVRVAGET